MTGSLDQAHLPGVAHCSRVFGQRADQGQVTITPDDQRLRAHPVLLLFVLLSVSAQSGSIIIEWSGDTIATAKVILVDVNLILLQVLFEQSIEDAEITGHDRNLGNVGHVEEEHVPRAEKLPPIGADGGRPHGRVRRVQHDKTIDQVRVLGGQQPRHNAAPVVSDENALVTGVLADQLGQVGHQHVGGVGAHRVRLVRVAVAAHVDRHHVIVGGELLNLILPRVPALGKAVHKQHQRLVDIARLDTMQANVLPGDYDQQISTILTPMFLTCFFS